MKGFAKLDLKISLVFTFLAFSIFLISCKKKQDVILSDDVTNLPPDTIGCNHNIKNGGVLVNNPNASVDYVVTCAIDLLGDVTIEAGTVLEFASEAGFHVNPSGSLSVNGTSDNPVTLTGIDKQSGSWKGLLFESDDIKNSMSHTKVLYAGGSAFNSNGDEGAVIVWSNTKLTMSNCTISNSSSYGLNASYGGADVILTNNAFKQNNMPIKINGDLITLPTANNDYAGNTKDFVHVEFYTSEISIPTVWHKVNVPYLTFGTQLSCNSTLTIEPGVEVHMGQATFINVQESGAIKAIGTSNDPIILRGADAVAGAWDGIVISFSSNPLNEISNARIMHAGGGNRKGAIYMWAKPFLNVSNVKFEDIKTCAIYAAPSTSSPNPNLKVTGCTYTNCGGEICGD